MIHRTYGQYVVAIIDVLGQKNKLLGLNYFPETDEDKKNISQILRDTAGYIEFLRKSFEGYYKAIKQPTGILEHLEPEQRQIAEKIRGTEDKIPIRYFSDSIIWEIAVDNSDEHCKTTREIWETLYALCGTFLVALAREKPFRGGIDLGFGVPIGNQNEIYSSALVKAHLLESEVANYPRVVIGDSLWQYLTFVESSTSDSIFSKSARGFATNAKSLTTIDNDNIRILDVIGEGAKSVNGGITKQIVTLAYSSLLKIQNKYAAQDSINNIKLSARYGLLRTYFESRLYLWK